jgi:hypothetical protein
VVRVVAGGVLLAAATLKGAEFLRSLSVPPLFGVSLPLWVPIAVVEIEILLGLWLVSGWWPMWARLAALLTFSLFLVVSASKFAIGAESCGSGDTDSR